ncbi:sigma-70 family RNA polymerase sigma factor [Streptomyces sp. IBSNAI001]|uniref:sigma-70 family RNA polymerase sigma factor n=1 Tax=Streptomyces sp. IBSNAI001 TaxID=3457499 RepID=UPI003FD49CB4
MVKKVVRTHTETPQPEALPQPRVEAALTLLGRFVVRGALTERAVAGVSRLAGLSTPETGDLRALATARFELVAVSSPTESIPSSSSAAHEQPAPSPSASDLGPERSAGSLVAAVAAARAVIDDDRRTRRPEKRILTAMEEVGLSVMLRGGPERVAIEPTDEELADLPAGDIRRLARDCLVLHNQGLAWSQVRAHAGQGLDEDDLFQHGMLGIMRAVRKFDARQGNKFSTYATWWVRQAMTRALADEGSAIRIPVHMHELVRKVGRVERDLLGAGKSRSAAAVAVACDLSVDKVEEIRRISRVTDSTDRIVGDGTHLGELLEIRTSLPSVEAAVMTSLASEDAQALVALLPERFARVVTLRVGLDGEDPATLDAIGAELGVTRERIRQLESQVLAVLRVAFRDPAGNPYSALASMLADAEGDGSVRNPVGVISRELGKPHWRAGIRALTAFREREGNALPDQDHVEDGFPLGAWVTEQRVEGRVGGHRLPAHQRILLDTLGMVWTAPKREEAWRRTERARRRARHAAGGRRLARPTRLWPPAPVPTEHDAMAPALPTTAPATVPEAEQTRESRRQDHPEPTDTAPELLPVEPTHPAEWLPTSPEHAPGPEPSSGCAQSTEGVTEHSAPALAGEDTGAPDRACAEGAPAEDTEALPPSGPSPERYAVRWDEAVSLPRALDRSVRWMAHYAHLALGHILLSEILGHSPALTVAKVADGSRLPDRPVVQALDVLVRVLDGLKERGARPEAFFEQSSPALLGRSPRAYLSAYPLTKPEARLALTDALKEFQLQPPSVTTTSQEAPSAISLPVSTEPEPAEDAIATLREARSAADDADRRFRQLEADVADRIARARAAERNRAHAQAQVEADKAAHRLQALEASMAEQVANARAEERNRARAAAQADLEQQIDQVRGEAARLVREAEAAAEAHVLQAKSRMADAATEREKGVTRRMEEELARRTRGVEEAARREVQALEARLRQAEAAFAERAQAAQAVEHEATARVRAVERWAELRIAEVQQAAHARITELEARLAPVHAPAPSQPGPQQPDPRRWWRRP